MLSDAVTAKVQAGEAREGIQVLDVAQILQRSLTSPVAVAATAGTAPAAEEVSVDMSASAAATTTEAPQE
jgi:hypothetical protein